ncbi:ROK family protein [Companilactobacillus kedongensis]|uniref:ROK family protein n=1 Tax=Companilactobacillus kedongensis TaxID=2486004 RepID=UPI000F78BF1C|nr:ROK family protein [Companilactobacillus kedongensis]
MDDKLFLAFDIGGTTIKYGIVDTELNVSDFGKVDTKHNKDGYILTALQEVTADFQKRYRLSGIGISTAGIVKDGSILFAGPTIPGYQGTKIQETLEKQTGLSVFVVNDVDAALLGEQLAGVAQDSETTYCVALGTGIGGAYLKDGKLLSGTHAYANSIGYILYDEKTKTYYEQRASTLTLEHNLKKYNTSVIDAFEYAKKGQEPYLQIIEGWSDEVARGLAEIVLLYDPEILVIGGAVSKQGQYLIDLLHRHMDNKIPDGLFKTELRIARLTDKAQIYGAISQFMN